MITGPHGERCDSVVCHKKIKFFGLHSSVVYLMNPEQRKVEKIKVDGCAIWDAETKRCDWLARTTWGSKEEIFIELKSAGRIQKAAAQLESTIKHLSNDVKGLRKRCLVVCTKHELITTIAQQLKEQFKRKYNAKLKTVRHCEEIPLVDA
ncbi:MAG: hypothetical protein ABSA47_13355 [Verrucomicrobiota bacterium]|jgi:hypothetical protein